MNDRKNSKPGNLSGQETSPSAGNQPAATGDAPAGLTPQGGAGTSASHAELAEQLSKVRSSVRENFGKVAMAIMMLPRYRGQLIGDLQHLVLEPLLRDRLAIAHPARQDGEADKGPAPDMLGFAIWASVSEEVDKRIREQVSAGVFPIRMKPEEWNSGGINWLFDVVAPNRKATASVIANLRQVTKEGPLALHPMVARLVDREDLEKMGAMRRQSADGAEAQTETTPDDATIN